MLGNLINSLLPRTNAATREALGHPARGIIGWVDPSGGSAGVPVTKDTALTVAAFWCGVRIIAETLGTLPCVLYRKLGEDSRERATDDYRYYLMHDEPHPSINPVTFFETSTAHIVCAGNAYSKIVRTQGGRIDRLEPRLPESVRVEVDDGMPRYHVEALREDITADDMLHVLGIGGDGITGWSVLKYGEQTIGSALAANTRAASQHKNNAMPTGAIVHPMRLQKDAREAFRREWNEVHEGAANAGRVAILHGGMDFKPFSMSNADAQFLESRVLSIRDIARLLRVPLHMLMDLENSSVRANIEQAGIEFLVYSMAPWITRWQQALNRKLLAREERGTLYFEFMLDALMRGDVAQRYGAYSVGRQWGWLSVNDIRRRENMNAIEGGDIYLQPVNMVEAGREVGRGMETEQILALHDNWVSKLSLILEQRAAIVAEITQGVDSIATAFQSAEGRIADKLVSLRSEGKEIAGVLQASISHGLGELRVAIQSAITAEGASIRESIIGKVDAIANGVEGMNASVEEMNASLGQAIARSVERVEGRIDEASDNLCRKLVSQMRRDFMLDKEKRAILKAVIAQVTRGESFIAAIDRWYGEMEWEYPELAAQHKSQLLAARDGDAAGFPERIKAVVESWRVIHEE